MNPRMNPRIDPRTNPRPQERPNPVARSTMTKHSPIAAALLALSCAAFAQNATAPSSGPIGSNAGTSTTESVLKKNLPPVNLQPGQPTDPTLRVKEPTRFVDLQARIAKLKTGDAKCPRDYHVAKAQAWLNFSRDQYHERAWQNDIQTATFNEARRIVDAIEANEDPGLDTPLVAGAQRLRPDLWAIAQKIKADVSEQSAGPLCCAQTETAFCEVQLVWSGHALANLGGWRRATPHVRMAEDLCEAAKQNQCPPPPPPAPPAPPPPPPAPPPPPPPAPTSETITLAAGALFKHGQSAIDQMLPAGRAQLDELVGKLNQMKGVERLVITGHADKTNNTGKKDYNDQLSLARASSVRSYLTVKGADMSRTEVASAGDRQPVTECPAPKGSNGITVGKASAKDMLAYIDCLQPNRRVVIEIFGMLEKR
jgi:outer membrane protein OmpA-like peptidoglycan-associated protein